MNNKNLITSLLIFSIVFSSSAFALPCAFFGTVKLDGNPINGTYVTAHLNDTGAYLATAIEPSAGFGNYTIIVNAADKIIRFKIAGIWANESEQICVSGNASYLDLTATTLPDGSPCDYSISCNSTFCVHNFCRPNDPYVGDGYCDSGENCLNSIDCPCPTGQLCGSDATCYTPQPPQQGGGVISGGGDFTPPACKENWTCTDWSECKAGMQFRNCTDSNKCGTTKNKTATNQTCTLETGGTPGVEGETKPTEETPEETTPPEETEELPQGPTGAFLGLSTTDWLLSIIVGIIAAVIIIFLLKRKKKS